MPTPTEPPLESETETTLEQQITNESAGRITGWFPGSSTEATVSAFASGLNVAYQYNFYTFLANSLKYAAKTITPDDCRELNVDPDTVDLDLINGLQSDADLEAVAAEKGVDRDQGAYARGELRITFASNGSHADAGLEVQAIAGDGTELIYVTTEPADAAENTPVVTVPIEAAERGTKYNLGQERLTSLPNGTSGATDSIQSVTNPEPVAGGEDPEDNESLRTRARGAELENATATDRFEKALNEETIDGGGVTDRDIKYDEYPTGVDDPDAEYNYSYTNWYIDYNGPTDSTHLRDSGGDPVEGGMQGLVEAEKPHGLAWYYVAPVEYTVDVTFEVAPMEPTQTTATPDDINTTQATQAAVSHLSDLGLGDDLSTNKLAHEVMNADADIDDIYYNVTVTAPDGTTSTVAMGGRQSIASGEKVVAGTVAVSPVEYSQLGV